MEATLADDAARCDPLAHAQGVNQASVAQIEVAHRWHPHRIETFKRSTATRCVETLTDVVGVDEQPQVHALDRTHPGGPMKKGRCSPLTHDEKPQGTTLERCTASILIPSESNWIHFQADCREILSGIHRDSLAKSSKLNG